MFCAVLKGRHRVGTTSIKLIFCHAFTIMDGLEIVRSDCAFDALEESGAYLYELPLWFGRRLKTGDKTRFRFHPAEVQFIISPLRHYARLRNRLTYGRSYAVSIIRGWQTTRVALDHTKIVSIQFKYLHSASKREITLWTVFVSRDENLSKIYREHRKPASLRSDENRNQLI